MTRALRHFDIYIISYISFFYTLFLLFFDLYVISSPRRFFIIIVSQLLIFFTFLITLYITASRQSQLVLLAIAALLTTAIPLNPSHPLPPDTRGSTQSTLLWHIALQNPSMSLRRTLPRPVRDSGTIRFVVRLGHPYSGKIQFELLIDGRIVGNTSHSPLNLPDESEGLDPYQLQLIFPSTILKHPDKVEAEIRQPEPGDGPRIQVIRGHLGNAFGQVSTSFGSDGHWLYGMPNPLTGCIQDATPVMWLEAS